MALDVDAVTDTSRQLCLVIVLISDKDFQLTITRVSFSSISLLEINMSSFVPTNYDLRTALLFCFHLKKTAAESHRMLVEAFGEHALGKTQCFEWFKRFKSGDFDVRNEELGRPPKKFEDTDLQALLDEDDAQTQQQLADQLNVTREAISLRLKVMGKINVYFMYKNSGFILTHLVCISQKKYRFNSDLKEP